MLGSSDNCDTIHDLEDWLPKVSEEKVAELVKQVIKADMCFIGDEKAPPPDGHSSQFFKGAWSVIGSDMCLAGEEFFQSEILLKEINASLISHIPKVENPQMIAQYIPIFLCNVMIIIYSVF